MKDFWQTPNGLLLFAEIRNLSVKGYDVISEAPKRSIPPVTAKYHIAALPSSDVIVTAISPYDIARADVNGYSLDRLRDALFFLGFASPVNLSTASA